MDLVKRFPFTIPSIIILAYAIPLIALLSEYEASLNFASRIIGLIAFMNVFTQVLLGGFRQFFNKHYNSARVFKFHNYLGIATLALSLIHALIEALKIGLFKVLLLNTSFFASLGTIALYIMTLTVITSDLKFLFKVNINQKAWRVIHVLNYALFPLLYAHAIILSSVLGQELVMQSLIIYLSLTIIAFIYRLLKH